MARPVPALEKAPAVLPSAAPVQVAVLAPAVQERHRTLR